MKLPSPEQVRIHDPRISPRENRAIDWDLVDVFLRKIIHSGALTLLGHKLGISRAALSKRRKQLKLHSLPEGRPQAILLTPLEHEVYAGYKGGTRQIDMARTRGVTKGAIFATIKRVEYKLEQQKLLGCIDCFGMGIVPCSTCKNIGPHHHVCLTCGGNSTTWASRGL